MCILVQNIGELRGRVQDPITGESKIQWSFSYPSTKTPLWSLATTIKEASFHPSFQAISLLSLMMLGGWGKLESLIKRRKIGWRRRIRLIWTYHFLSYLRCSSCCYKEVNRDLFEYEVVYTFPNVPENHHNKAHYGLIMLSVERRLDLIPPGSKRKGLVLIRGVAVVVGELNLLCMLTLKEKMLYNLFF